MINAKNKWYQSASFVKAVVVLVGAFGAALSPTIRNIISSPFSIGAGAIINTKSDSRDVNITGGSGGDKDGDLNFTGGIGGLTIKAGDAKQYPRLARGLSP